MFADDGTALIHDRPGLDPLAEAVFQQRAVAAVRDEADLLALWLERGNQAEGPGLLADLGLGPIADRKAQDRELLLAKLVEHVGLVFALVGGSPQAVTVGTLIDARIVAGRQKVGAQRQRLAQEEAELDRLVAANAGIGRAPLQICLCEGVDDRRPKVVFEIQDVIGNAQPVGDPAGVLDRVQRTAAVVLVEVLERHLLGPELEGDAEDVMALLTHQGRGDRRVDAAAHRDGDFHGCSSLSTPMPRLRQYSSARSTSAASPSRSSSTQPVSLPTSARRMLVTTL